MAPQKGPRGAHSTALLHHVYGIDATGARLFGVVGDRPIPMCSDFGPGGGGLGLRPKIEAFFCLRGF